MPVYNPPPPDPGAPPIPPPNPPPVPCTVDAPVELSPRMKKFNEFYAQWYEMFQSEPNAQKLSHKEMTLAAAAAGWNAAWDAKNGPGKGDL